MHLPILFLAHNVTPEEGEDEEKGGGEGEGMEEVL